MGTKEYPLRRHHQEPIERSAPADGADAIANRNAEIEKAVKDLDASRAVIKKSLSQNNLKALQGMRQVRGAQ